jgi:hypothetical protein
MLVGHRSRHVVLPIRVSRRIRPRFTSPGSRLATASGRDRWRFTGPRWPSICGLTGSRSAHGTAQRPQDRRLAGRRSGRTDGSVRLKSRNPVCVELIGLSTVPDHQLPIRRNIKTEIVEHLLCSAGRICRQLLIRHLARHDAVGGEPDCPVRLGSLDRGDKPTNQLFVVMRILTSGRDGLTRMPEMGLQ